MDNDSQRNSHLTPTSDVLQSLLQNGKSPLAKGFTRWRVWREWGQIVGPELARHTEPVDYKQGILFIWVKSSARMQEVSFLSREIMHKINGFLKRKWVNRLRYTLNPHKLPPVDQVGKGLNQLLGKK